MSKVFKQRVKLIVCVKKDYTQYLVICPNCDKVMMNVHITNDDDLLEFTNVFKKWIEKQAIIEEIEPKNFYKVCVSYQRIRIVNITSKNSFTYNNLKKSKNTDIEIYKKIELCIINSLFLINSL